ncbi:MAG: protein phosphatase 2C domain-containing protein [Blautia sp.]
MEIVAHSVTIKGMRKPVNQDNYGYSVKKVNATTVSFSVVCDGVGGLENGEYASALVVQYFMEWFEKRFSAIYSVGINGVRLEKEWNQVLYEAHEKILNIGEVKDIQLGTTVAALLLFENQYYAMNVGDTRVYCIDDQIRRITKDHTLMQKKLDEGTLSLDEAAAFPCKNIITQCVGVKHDVTMSFYQGMVKGTSVWLVCTDGYRNRISEKAIGNILGIFQLKNYNDFCEKVEKISTYVLEHNEKDDITAVALWLKENDSMKLYNNFLGKEVKMIFCSKCGKKCNDNDLFCSGCGTPLNKTSNRDFGSPIDQKTSIMEQYDNYDATIVHHFEDDETTVILDEKKDRASFVNTPKKEKKAKPERKKERAPKKENKSSGGPLRIVIYILGGILVLLLILIAVSSFL